MSKFRVGDVCIYIDEAANPKMVNAECVIVGLCDENTGDHLCEFPGFPSPISTGLWACFGYQLRLKRPPSWDKWITDTREVEREKDLVQV